MIATMPKIPDDEENIQRLGAALAGLFPRGVHLVGVQDFQRFVLLLQQANDLAHMADALTRGRPEAKANGPVNGPSGPLPSSYGAMSARPKPAPSSEESAKQA